jgi:hypothetical protein
MKARIAATLIAENRYSTAPNARTLTRLTARSAKPNPPIHHAPATSGSQ